MTNRFNLQ
ncbi:Protein of unknown function [Bacillus cytotoxicus]|uniref:Uncharacterized protein n=1 Tax=Bacillus cytotoxicus TaxID=580165 RepID=A0AAX2CCZ7_9BACI|nr:Protein of unknown function [Bacillus cytotoxicus]